MIEILFLIFVIILGALAFRILIKSKSLEELGIFLLLSGFLIMSVGAYLDIYNLAVIGFAIFCYAGGFISGIVIAKK